MLSKSIRISSLILATVQSINMAKTAGITYYGPCKLAWTGSFRTISKSDEKLIDWINNLGSIF